MANPSSELGKDPDIDFVSLGMVVIDEIRLPSRPPILDIAGGSGAFSTFRYRVFAARNRACRVGCLVVAGSDFPQLIQKQLARWQVALRIKTIAKARSTRGLLEYEDDTFGPKTFRYLTTPLKASPTDLAETGFLGAAAVHVLATPGEVAAQVAQLRALRVQRGITESPFIVWEPFPAACTIANRQAFLEACKLVDVFSPNHLEMEALFETAATTAPYHKGKLEEYAQEFAKATGPCGSGAVIVRCGEHGSLTVQDGPVKLWLPPYYHMGSSDVVDPTGAGNAFLGAFMAGWKATGDLQEASCYGTVSASFAIKQIGLPSLDFDGDDGLCNGVRVLDRLAQYKVRINQI